jgi:hypothetical protein
VARSVAARYLVAALAFMAAAIWLGLSLTGGFACLFVFVLALQAVRLYQRRSDLRSRRSPSRRERPSRHEPGLAEQRLSSPSSPAPPRRARSRSGGRVYDGGREEFGVPVAGIVRPSASTPSFVQADRGSASLG